jgi:hypothetical protein
MKGIQYVVDEKGRRVAVQIDLKEHGEWWEDFYDALISESRRDEPEVSLEEVKRQLRNSGKRK